MEMRQCLAVMSAGSISGGSMAEKGRLAHLARPGAEIRVRVTPKAARNRIVASEEGIRVYVTAPPEGGKATEAVRKLLAGALGVAKTRLVLVRGATAREKVFRLEE